MRLQDRLDQASPWGITMLRVVVGIVLFAHGFQKFFMTGLPDVAAGFGQMGIPLPMLAAVFSAVVEFVGGLLLIIGLFTRFAAVLGAINFLGALFFAHLGQGFFLPGIEFVLVLAVANVALVLLGPGYLAVDNMVGRRLDVGEPPHGYAHLSPGPPGDAEGGLPGTQDTRGRRYPITP